MVRKKIGSCEKIIGDWINQKGKFHWSVSKNNCQETNQDFRSYLDLGQNGANILKYFWFQSEAPFAFLKTVYSINILYKVIQEEKQNTWYHFTNRRIQDKLYYSVHLYFWLSFTSYGMEFVSYCNKQSISEVLFATLLLSLHMY